MRTHCAGVLAEGLCSELIDALEFLHISSHACLEPRPLFLELGASRHDPHRRVPLALMAGERREFAVVPIADRLAVVDNFRFEQQQRLRPVRFQPLLAEEVRIARCDDPADCQPASDFVVGVKTVSMPGIMSDDHGRTCLSNHAADRGSLSRTGNQLSVYQSERVHSSDPQRLSGPLLFAASGFGELRRINLRVPRTLRSIGQDEKMDCAPGVCPFRQRRATTELDVIGMCSDGQYPWWNLKVRSTQGASRARSDARSVSTSTSKASDGSWTTRVAIPNRVASSK